MVGICSDQNGTRAKSAPLLEPSQVAEWLGVSSGWVRDHATRKEPRLKAIKVGKLLRFRPEDIEDFIQRCCQ